MLIIKGFSAFGLKGRKKNDVKESNVLLNKIDNGRERKKCGIYSRLMLDPSQL